MNFKEYKKLLRLSNLVKELKFVPNLSIIQIGDNEASNKYIAKKITFLEVIDNLLIAANFNRNDEE